MKALLYSCLLPAIAATSFAAAPQFKPRTDVTTGFKYLYGMEVADFNGDGKPDIVATDNYAKNVYVYLNDGSGEFDSPKITPLTMAALGPGQIVAGDFNEDGKQDIIIGTVAGLQSDLLLTGNGDGSFTQQQDLPNSGGFVSAIATDINQDKHLDLICGGNGSLTVRMGDGRGNFQQVTTFAQGSTGLFTSVASADFNTDGKLDFVAVSPIQTAGIRYFAGYGDTTFAPPLLLQNTTMSAPGSIATADFDGDNNPDLLVSSGLSATYVISGSGNGTFNLAGATKLPSPVIPHLTLAPGTTIVSPWVAAADLNGDGHMDIISADPYNTKLGLLMNDGTGKFPNSLVDFDQSIDAATALVRTSDLNGDGLPDIILASSLSQNISIFLSVKPKISPVVTVASSDPFTFVNSPINVTIKVAGSSSMVPTGSITLMDNSISLGQQSLDGDGQAVLTFSNLAAGYHTFSASYTGDTNFNSGNSILVGQAITDMQVASTTPSQTVTAGTAATYNLTVTPLGGIVGANGTITITCSQLPALATCDPVTVPLFDKPAAATLTIKTIAPIRSRRTSSHYAFILFPLFTVCFVRRRRMFTPLLCVTIICSLGLFATGCSSSNSSTTIPGTPSGSSTFTITASSILSGKTFTRTTTAILVVQ